MVSDCNVSKDNTRTNKRWMIQDVEYLKLMYPITSKTKIAKEMGITYQSVRGAIARFEIKKKL